MPHHFGYRARTRDLFSKPFRQHGAIKMSNYLTVFRVGDIVDIKADSAIHKGMPHKFYHGKTGRVWNVTKRAVGVEVNKQVGNRIIKKRIHVRVEHVRHSKSRQEFLDRVVANAQAKKAAKAENKPVPELRRKPQQPRDGTIVKASKDSVKTIWVPIYDEVF
mmetsp:Transcript_10917/g.30645  ORF Transcript_10917/g.30645 Transcript_10917/m.30645 type:complete len:162 (+) Transcript_10917:92-577(+)|eukprot:CAMPEP_0119124702 /NCGR_PEP_ID=MMETSP1310-20130426/4240_1 /TAXON_ID=464262 /ORGANISM="Genus nov. species nov., Strain RCC2339" /LENGTH=161 /DNA_ID=CAMNT_0007114693 /DNA_START=102 /DNA_END=587 /DNA_ORIENTATION=+